MYPKLVVEISVCGFEYAYTRLHGPSYAVLLEIWSAPRTARSYIDWVDRVSPASKVNDVEIFV